MPIDCIELYISIVQKLLPVTSPTIGYLGMNPNAIIIISPFVRSKLNNNFNKHSWYKLLLQKDQKKKLKTYKHNYTNLFLRLFFSSLNH